MGFCAKANIESLFRAQKKNACWQSYPVSPITDIDLWAFGTLPGHTKSYFTKFDTPTIHNVPVTNALVFIDKVRHFPLELPRIGVVPAEFHLPNLHQHSQMRYSPFS